MEILEIIEIRNVAAQGITRPVFCIASNNETYVVKGAYAGKEALINEWIASRLGHALGLPIPPCALLRVPSEIFDYSSQKEELALLGRDTLFGSLWQRDMVELCNADIPAVDLRLRAKILAFDHWIGNGDRTLSPHGGNPNLLWSPSRSCLSVIDHNLAFDYTDALVNLTDHVFFEARSIWSTTFCQEMESQFDGAFRQLDDILRELPEEWTEPDSDKIDRYLKASLSRFHADSAKFWNKL